MKTRVRAMTNETILQSFYWEMCTEEYEDKYPEECDLWQLLKKEASNLKDIGFTSVWIPPATKGKAGTYDVGYGIYDLWDLGEFDQQGTIRTKYGTKEELLKALASLHQNEMRVYFDAVLNHRFGADETEEVELEDDGKAEVWTKFNFPGRNNKYSDCKLDWHSFDGVDWNERTKEIGRYLFEAKDWDWSYGDDFLMGADLDYNNENVRNDVIKWGKWIINDLGFDGFRIDAAKHIDSGFLRDFINEINENSNKDVFFGGEAWIEEEDILCDFINQINTKHLKVFDYPLRSLFTQMKNRELNMKDLKNNGIVNKEGYKDKSVTFIDTHDTDRDNPPKDVESISHYKYQAYTYILMREYGLPVVYWKDYFTRKMSEGIKPLINARKNYAYGKGYESEATDQSTYCYIREGNNSSSGLVMLITQETSGDIIEKEIDSKNSNTEYYDITGHIEEDVKTDDNGKAHFKVIAKEDKGWSVWVKK